MSAASQTDTVGMDYLESTPRKLVTVYLPLLVFLFVLAIFVAALFSKIGRAHV